MPCYVVINGMKQEMDEDIFDQMVEALHHSSNPHNSPTSNTHSLETRWKLWQETIRPRLLMTIVWNTMVIEIQSKITIKNPSNAQTADGPSAVNPICQNTVKPRDVWANKPTVETLNSNPDPTNSNRRPSPKKLLKEMPPYIHIY